MPADVITCPNCGASDIPIRYARDYAPCPYCNATIRVADDRPNTTDAFKERIERERAERPPAQAQENGGLLILLSLLGRLRARARRAAIWAVVLAIVLILGLCALRFLAP